MLCHSISQEARRCCSHKKYVLDNWVSALMCGLAYSCPEPPPLRLPPVFPPPTWRATGHMLCFTGRSKLSISGDLFEAELHRGNNLHNFG